MSLQTPKVLAEIDVERAAQDAKWGEQNHPDGTDDSRFAKELRDLAREQCDAAHKNGTLTWHHIATEEMMEARAEVDPVKLRGELIQCAAVLVAWIEAIDRRTA